MDEFQIQSEPEAETAEALVMEYEDGYAIRFCEEGCRGFIRWQAGKLTTEYRHYQDPGMFTPFRAHVSLFHLLGYGETRDEALSMARKNPNGRNGR